MKLNAVRSLHNVGIVPNGDQGAPVQNDDASSPGRFEAVDSLESAQTETALRAKLRVLSEGASASGVSRARPQSGDEPNGRSGRRGGTGRPEAGPRPELRPADAENSVEAAYASRQRDSLLERLVRDMDPPASDAQRTTLRAALEAFSLRDLRRMDQAGVRITRANQLPPDLDGLVETPPQSTRARYLHAVKLVQVRDSASVNDIVHELAHAKDDLANDGPSTALDRIRSDDRRSAAILRRHRRNTFRSETGARVRTEVDGRAASMTFDQMLERYRERVSLREHAFGNPGTRTGYSLRDAQEFFAEGYAVFHGDSLYAQGHLALFAPELWSHLEMEARARGLDVPNRQAALGALPEALVRSVRGG